LYLKVKSLKLDYKEERGEKRVAKCTYKEWKLVNFKGCRFPIES